APFDSRAPLCFFCVVALATERPASSLVPQWAWSNAGRLFRDRDSKPSFFALGKRPISRDVRGCSAILSSTRTYLKKSFFWLRKRLDLAVGTPWRIPRQKRVLRNKHGQLVAGIDTRNGWHGIVREEIC